MDPQTTPNTTGVTPPPTTPQGGTSIPVQSSSASQAATSTPVQVSSTQAPASTPMSTTTPTSAPVQVGSPVTQAPPVIPKMETMAQMSAAAQAAPVAPKPTTPVSSPLSALRPEIKTSAPAPTPSAQPAKPAAPTNGGGSDVGKTLLFVVLGLIFGALLVALYFMFLAPKPEPVTVEKIVEKVVVATSTPVTIQNTNMPPARTYSFYSMPISLQSGVASSTSPADKELFDKIMTIVKKEAAYFGTEISSILTSGNFALATALIPKDSGGENNIVIDTRTNKVTDKFILQSRYYIDQGTFVFGSDAAGLSYYSYGATSSIKFPNSTLSGNQTYVEAGGPMGFVEFKVIATTTNSITFGVYDKTKTTIAPGDDTSHAQKVGERTFILP